MWNHSVCKLCVRERGGGGLLVMQETTLQNLKISHVIEYRKVIHSRLGVWKMSHFLIKIK